MTRDHRASQIWNAPICGENYWDVLDKYRTNKDFGSAVKATNFKREPRKEEDSVAENLEESEERTRTPEGEIADLEA